MKKRPLAALCIGLMIAIWLCRIGGIPIFGEPPLTEEEKNWLSEGQQVTLTGVVADRRISSDSVRYTLRHVRVTVRDRQIPFSGVFVSTAYNGEKSAAEPGDVIRAAGELRPVEKAGNPGQFDSASYYACKKIYYRMWCDKPPEIARRMNGRKLLFRLRERLLSLYQTSMHEDPAGILSAMLLGDKEFLTDESQRNFQAGGCLHLLVISGLHVMLLGMGLLQILLRLRMPQTPACITASAVMVFYTALTGFPVAAVRACLMFLILVLARVLRRSYDSACAMALAAILILLAEPGWLFHSGFQLSFAAAAAASLVSPVLSRTLAVCGREERKEPAGKAEEEEDDRRGRIKKEARILLKKMRENAVLWCAVQLCTLPLTAYYFFEVPVWSLPLNLLLVPCVQYVLGAGVVGSLAALVFPRAAKGLLLPADLGLGVFDKVLSLSRILPSGTVVCGRPTLFQLAVYYAVLLTVLWLLQRQTGRKMRQKNRDEVRRAAYRCALMMAAACFVLFFRRQPAFSLTTLDVGQGDCLSIQVGKNVILSDGGSTNVQEVGKYRILPYLESRGISRINTVCISHNDADHMNGIEEILVMIAEKKTAVRIGCVCMPAWMEQTEDGRRIAAEAAAAGASTGFLQRGDALEAGDLRIEVLHPFRPLQKEETEKEKKETDGKEKEEPVWVDRTVRVENGVPTGGSQSGNTGSLVLQVKYRDFTALLTGDLEKEGEEEMLPWLTDIDCLKVGHHGSRWSTSKEFLEVTQPEVALISAPQKSQYGHPHPDNISRLEGFGAEIFATKDAGAIEIKAEKGGMVLKTFYGSP